ncbi:MAG: PadR family transcriptional regulator [Candidatus Micrarchaeota archaeon]
MRIKGKGTNEIKLEKEYDLKTIRRLVHSLSYGNIWLAILSIIKARKKAYAYALDSEIEEKFSFKPNKIMIYVVLYKLEEEKLIESAFEERRKYYILSEKGKSALVFAKNYLSKLAKVL